LLNEGQAKDNRQDSGRTPGSKSGRSNSNGAGSKGSNRKEPRYDVRKSNRVVSDDSVVKKVTLSDSEIAEAKKKLPDAIFDNSFSEVNDAEQFHKLISDSKKGNKHAAIVFVSPEILNRYIEIRKSNGGALIM